MAGADRRRRRLRHQAVQPRRDRRPGARHPAPHRAASPRTRHPAFADLELDESAPRGVPRPASADQADRDRVQPAPLLHAQPAPRALEGPDPRPRVALRLRRRRNVVETYVSYLRKKLDALGPPLIHTSARSGTRSEPSATAQPRVPARPAPARRASRSPAVGLAVADVATYSALQLVPHPAVDQQLDATTTSPSSRPRAGPGRCRRGGTGRRPPTGARPARSAATLRVADGSRARRHSGIVQLGERSTALRPGRPRRDASPRRPTAADGSIATSRAPSAQRRAALPRAGPRSTRGAPSATFVIVAQPARRLDQHAAPPAPRSSSLVTPAACSLAICCSGSGSCASGCGRSRTIERHGRRDRRRRPLPAGRARRTSAPRSAGWPRLNMMLGADRGRSAERAAVGARTAPLRRRRLARAAHAARGRVGLRRALRAAAPPAARGPRARDDAGSARETRAHEPARRRPPLLARLDEGRRSTETRSRSTGLAGRGRRHRQRVEPAGRSCSTAEPVEVIGDRDRLRQVIDNLLAQRPGPHPAGHGGAVRVGRGDGRDRASSRSRDDGPGHAGRRGSPTSSSASTAPTASRARASGGVGLGLSIVAAIAAAHGGRPTQAPTHRVRPSRSNFRSPRGEAGLEATPSSPATARGESL